ncbi:MAG: hypothetical protein ACRC0C_08550, partial [Gibbsiella quercinecans]|uniref:hypothetical protein n=1 Tax=Gibbsiella quercinecans TaxID=929813 RepID=UPI003F2EFAD8
PPAVYLPVQILHSLFSTPKCREPSPYDKTYTSLMAKPYRRGHALCSLFFSSSKWKLRDQ